MCKALKKRSEKYEKNEKKNKKKKHKSVDRILNSGNQRMRANGTDTETRSGGLSSGPSPNQSFQVDPHQDII